MSLMRIQDIRYVPLHSSSRVVFQLRCSLPAEMVEGVCAAMDMRTLIDFRSSTRDASDFVAVELNRTLTHLLERFVSDAQGFRSMMRARDCVISGSAALWFFDRTANWQPGDLDVYTPHGQWEDVVTYLERNENGVVQRPPPSVAHLHFDYSANHGIAAVAHVTTPRGVIDVIQSQNENPLWPVAYFWTDLLKNVLGADQAVCASWSLLAAKRGILVPRTLSDKECVVVAKYVERGYSFALSPQDWLQPSDERCVWSLCPHRVRTFSDDRALKITYDILQPDKNTDVVEAVQGVVAVGWKLAGAKCSTQCRGIPRVGPIILYAVPGDIVRWAARNDTQLLAD